MPNGLKQLKGFTNRLTKCQKQGIMLEESGHRAMNQEVIRPNQQRFLRCRNRSQRSKRVAALIKLRILKIMSTNYSRIIGHKYT